MWRKKKEKKKRLLVSVLGIGHSDWIIFRARHWLGSMIKNRVDVTIGDFNGGIEIAHDESTLKDLEHSRPHEVDSVRYTPTLCQVNSLLFLSSIVVTLIPRFFMHYRQNFATLTNHIYVTMSAQPLSSFYRFLLPLLHQKWRRRLLKSYRRRLLRNQVVQFSQKSWQASQGQMTALTSVLSVPKRFQKANELFAPVHHGTSPASVWANSGLLLHFQKHQ